MERHSWLSSSSKVSCWFFLFLLGSFSWLLIIEYQSFQVLALNTVNFGWQFIYSHLQNIRQEATKEGRADLGSRREELILVHMSSMRCRLCCSRNAQQLVTPCPQELEFGCFSFLIQLRTSDYGVMLCTFKVVLSSPSKLFWKYPYTYL